MNEKPRRIKTTKTTTIITITFQGSLEGILSFFSRADFVILVKGIIFCSFLTLFCFWQHKTDRPGKREKGKITSGFGKNGLRYER